MAPPDTDPAALRAVGSLAILPADPAAATEEIERRREEIGFSYVVVGANAADTLARSSPRRPVASLVRQSVRCRTFHEVLHYDRADDETALHVHGHR